jgi:hypothetical protein
MTPSRDRTATAKKTGNIGKQSQRHGHPKVGRTSDAYQAPVRNRAQREELFHGSKTISRGIISGTPANLSMGPSPTSPNRPAAKNVDKSLRATVTDPSAPAAAGNYNQFDAVTTNADGSKSSHLFDTYQAANLYAQNQLLNGDLADGSASQIDIVGKHKPKPVETATLSYDENAKVSFDPPPRKPDPKPDTRQEVLKTIKADPLAKKSQRKADAVAKTNPAPAGKAASSNSGKAQPDTPAKRQNELRDNAIKVIGDGADGVVKPSENGLKVLKRGAAQAKGLIGPIARSEIEDAEKVFKSAQRFLRPVKIMTDACGIYNYIKQHPKEDIVTAANDILTGKLAGKMAGDLTLAAGTAVCTAVGLGTLGVGGAICEGVAIGISGLVSDDVEGLVTDKLREMNSRSTSQQK